MAFIRNRFLTALIGAGSLWATAAQAVPYTDEATFQANACTLAIPGVGIAGLTLMRKRVQ